LEHGLPAKYRMLHEVTNDEILPKQKYVMTE